MALSLQWVGQGRWRRILFYVVNWSRNKLISKSIDYILFIYTISQLNCPKTIKWSSPHAPHFSVAQFDGLNIEITSHPIVIILRAISINLQTNQRQWRRWRCWQCGNKVNEENNNNMTTTQQPTWRSTRQPTRRENNWAAGMKLCVKLCFFSVQVCLDPWTVLRQPDLQRYFFLGGKGMFLCFYVKKMCLWTLPYWE